MGRSTHGTGSTRMAGRDLAVAGGDAGQRSCHGWPVAATILLVVGIGHLAGAVAAGGASFLFPWLILPLALWFVAGGGYGRLRRTAGPAGRGTSKDGETPSGRVVDREQRLEAELAGARREVKELQEQLRWHTRLLAAQGQGRDDAGQGGATEGHRS